MEMRQLKVTTGRRQLAAPLSSDLRERHKRRSFPVRMGDSVKIVRGDFTGIEGKVTEIDTKSRRIYVEGVTREKASGGSATIPIHPSKVVITNLNLSDKWRSDALSTVKEDSAPQELKKEET